MMVRGYWWRCWLLDSPATVVRWHNWGRWSEGASRGDGGRIGWHWQQLFPEYVAKIMN